MEWLFCMTSIRGVTTFGQLGETILDIVMKPLHHVQCFRLDIIFDRYEHPHSIKSFARARRHTVDSIEVRIHGQNIPLPKDWNCFMRRSKT